MRIAAVTVLCAGCAGCAGQSLFGIEYPDREYWKGYLLDAGETLSAPREWERRDWLAFGAVAGASAVVYGQDEYVRDAVQDARTSGTERVADFAKLLGDGEWLVSGLVLTYGVACLADDPRLKEAALLGTESFALAGGFNAGLKWLFGRKRPRKSSGPDDFLGPSWLTDPAMPSGHTAVAFAVASSFALEYRNPWVSAVAYALAGLVGWSRIHDDAHWASDVFVGAAVGTLTAGVIYRARGRRKAVTSPAVSRLYYGDLTE